jgi:competence protein ComEA
MNKGLGTGGLVRRRAFRALARLSAVAVAAALVATVVAQGFSPAVVQGQSVPSGSQSRFPAGPGREALFKVCSDCHGPESVLGQLKTHDEWRKTLDEMANNGAKGSDEEWDQILAYLDKHYSLIFVNKAAAKDLASTLDVGLPVAEAIVRRREEGGAFKSIDDLKQVPGLAASAVDTRKDRLVF